MSIVTYEERGTVRSFDRSDQIDDLGILVRPVIPKWPPALHCRGRGVRASECPCVAIAVVPGEL